MALYFFSISTILGGPGGPLAARGTDGFSSLFSHSDIESEPVPLTSDFCKFFCQMLGKKGKLQQIVDFFFNFHKTSIFAHKIEANINASEVARLLEGFLVR